MALLAGLARVYFGVHSTLQVACGWALGLALVLVAARLEPWLARRWAAAKPAARWIAVVVPPVALLGIGLLLRGWLETWWAAPAEWAERHRAAAELLGGDQGLRLFDPSPLARWCGALLGASLAAAWWAAPGRVALTVRTWPRRLVHTAIGAAAAGAAIQIGGMAMSALGELVEFARFALLLWVIAVPAPCLAEWLCSRLGSDVGGVPKS
jgi:hypothetical protein